MMHFQDKFYPKALQFLLQECRCEGLFCDVCLVVDGHQFQAHKLVLSAASPYFRAMFDAKSSFIESHQEKVHLHGIDKDTLSCILNFIYCSDIEINEENVYLLMEGASLFQIYALRKFINFYLQSSLTIENCLELYEMANLHQYNDLANKVFHFILENFLHIVDTEEFLKIQFEVLLEIISSDLLEITNEDVLLENVLKWVKADTEVRKNHLEGLMSEINLHLLSPEFLSTIKDDPLLADDIKIKIEKISNSIFPKSKMVVLRKEISVWGKNNFQSIRHKSEKPVIFAIGGESSGKASQNVECFTLGYDKWRCIVPEYIIKRYETKYTRVLPPLRCARYYAASAYDAYNVYVMGGRNSTSLLDECEVFNIRTNQWKYFDKLPIKLFASSAAFLEGHLIVVGGCSEEGVSNKVWKFDKARNCWVSMPPINTPRHHHGSVAIGGSIFVIGGYDNHQCALRTCEKFDVGCNKWIEISMMHEPRAKFGCTAINDCIYVFGGTCNQNSCFKSVEKYNIFTDEWTFESEMTISRHSFSVAAADHEIFCLGGSDSIHFLDTVEKYSLRTKRWHSVHSMQISRLGPAAAALWVPYTLRE